MESWSTVHARRADRAACTSAGMPGNGYSGRANNLEVLTDPYGGYDVPGPYGAVICGMSGPCAVLSDCWCGGIQQLHVDADEGARCRLRQ